MAFALPLIAVGIPGCSLAPPKATHHVFVLVLENQDFNDTFASDPFFSSLARRGRLYPDEYAITHGSLPNCVALASGQPPNPDTATDCPHFDDYNASRNHGCVYPVSTHMIGDELDAAGQTWSAYIEGLGPRDCPHPPPGGHDNWTDSGAFAFRHTPFLFFHSLIDSSSRCNKDIKNLTTLENDLATAASTRQLTWLVPTLCHSGHVCNGQDARASMRAFTSQWVARVQSSSAYQRDGLLYVLFDESRTDHASCCGMPDPAGGRTGALVLGPCVPVGAIDSTRLNHYGLLAQWEDALGVPRLGLSFQADAPNPCMPSH